MDDEKHIRRGNCWGGNTRIDICTSHDEPRGDCARCPRCPRCVAEGLVPEDGDCLERHEAKS